MTSDQNRDTHASFFFLIVSIVSYPLIFRYIESEPLAEISPRFWPLMTVTLLLVFSFLAFIKGLRRGEKLNVKMVVNALASPQRQYLFLAIAIVYIKSMEYFGFLVSSIFSLPIFLYFFGSRKKGLNLVLSVVYIGIVFYCFAEVFKISFPKWDI